MNRLATPTMEGSGPWPGGSGDNRPWHQSMRSGVESWNAGLYHTIQDSRADPFFPPCVRFLKGFRYSKKV